MPSTGFNLDPTRNKFILQEEMAGQDKYWSTNTSYDDLLMAHGQHVRDFTDLSFLAKGFAYNRLNVNLSKTLNPLYEFASAGGGVEVVDKNWVRWKIYGEPDRRAMSWGNVNDQDYLGTAGMPFTIVLDVDWFKEHDILVPLINKRAQVVVMSEGGIPHDGGYRYEVVLLEEADTAFMPVEYLAAGEYWLQAGSVTSWEKAGTFGTLQFGEGFSYIEFEVPLTTMAKTFEIEGEAHRQFGNLRLSRCDEYKQPIPEGTKITNYIELRANKQIEDEKELFMAYGTKTEHLLDNNTGKQITTGPGYFEYAESGNTIPYSPEVNNLDFLTDQFDQLWFNRIPAAQRSVVLLGGTAFVKKFSEWVNQKFNSQAVQIPYTFYLKNGTPFDKSNGRDGYKYVAPQFTEYVLPTFGTIKVAIWDLLDNTRINGVNYPGSFYPVSSYEAYAFDIGFGEPNVKFLRRDDNMISTYQVGLWSPFGATGQDNPVFKSASYTDESYRWLYRETFGLIVIDPTRMVRLVPNVSY